MKRGTPGFQEIYERGGGEIRVEVGVLRSQQGTKYSGGLRNITLLGGDGAETQEGERQKRAMVLGRTYLLVEGSPSFDNADSGGMLKKGGGGI